MKENQSLICLLLLNEGESKFNLFYRSQNTDNDALQLSNLKLHGYEKKSS